MEQFESLSRIPFISSGKLFRRYFEIEAASESVSLDNSFDKALMAGDLPSKGNPFAGSDRRLTESVPPKHVRMTLQRDQPQPHAFDYASVGS